MKNCPNCHFENPEESAFCSNCGAPMNGQPAYQPAYQPIPNPYDHTADFDEQDIADHKLLAMCGYLLSIPGVLIALLADRDSPYNQYHIRQALRFMILNALIFLLSGLLVWTVVVPILGGVLLAILLVIRAICFVDVCRGKAIDPWLVRSLKFLGR